MNKMNSSSCTAYVTDSVRSFLSPFISA